MRRTLFTALLMAAGPLAQAAATPLPPATTPDDVRAVSPALHGHAQQLLAGEVWKRPGLAPRDRSLITVAALVARHQTAEMAFHMHLALDNGVKASEISETITHLAFYAGWGPAMAAVPVARERADTNGGRRAAVAPGGLCGLAERVLGDSRGQDRFRRAAPAAAVSAAICAALTAAG